MTRFLDGPASGVSLVLGRAPLLLRVVQSAGGEWDALDQIDDAPAPGETIHLYWIATRQPRVAFLDYQDRTGRRRGQRMESADYVAYPAPPPDEVMRDNQRWRAWCDANEQTIRQRWSQMMARREEVSGA